VIAHILDARPVWIKEFASALSAVTPTIGWCPDVTNTGRIREYEKETLLNDPPLRIRSFPLQRGFAKFPVNLVAPETDRLVERLMRASDDSRDAVLISCLPHYASVTEKWPDQVIYYATDLFVAYWDNARLINELEERSCAAADLVCPNSGRVAEQLIREARCDSQRSIAWQLSQASAAKRTTDTRSGHESTRLKPVGMRDSVGSTQPAVKRIPTSNSLEKNERSQTGGFRWEWTLEK